MNSVPGWRRARLALAAGSIAASIAAPACADDLARARESATTAQMRNLGLALLSWVEDQRIEAKLRAPGAPAAAGGSLHYDPTAAADYALLGPELRLSREELVRVLQPSSELRFMAEVPEVDGWGRPFEVYLRRTDVMTQRVVAIRSAGANGVFEGDRYPVGPIGAQDAADDIVWADGLFVRWPAWSRP
jgi:hypothetical protein